MIVKGGDRALERMTRRMTDGADDLGMRDRKVTANESGVQGERAASELEVTMRAIVDGKEGEIHRFLIKRIGSP